MAHLPASDQYDIFKICQFHATKGSLPPPQVQRPFRRYARRIRCENIPPGVCEAPRSGDDLVYAAC